LARVQERGSDVALASTECHDPFGACVGERPTNSKAQRDKHKSRDDFSRVEDLQNLVRLAVVIINTQQNEAGVGDHLFAAAVATVSYDSEHIAGRLL
jgi:hypothetical protein